MKKIIAKYYSYYHYRYTNFWKKNPIFLQKKILLNLIKKSKNTKFGKKYLFKTIKTIEDFQKNVPINNYEGFQEYIEDIKNGLKNILYKGSPLYLVKTSGTTSGTKYLPLTKNAINNHINAIKSLILNYLYKTKKFYLLDNKMIFLQGSPKLDFTYKIPNARLSGIMAYYIPKYLKKNRIPSWETNCIIDWEDKINKIVAETIDQKISIIGGIPPWIVMYFEQLIKKKNIKIGQLFPNLELIITGGVNYEPYQNKIESMLGKKIQILQTFPASEGFFAYQNELENEDLLLLINHGIFYEFIDLEDYKQSLKDTITLSDVKLNKDYAMIITTNSGLWRYDLGDTIRFTSICPYKILVTGRTEHYISAFGEHVINYEVEYAIKKTIKKFPCSIIEFTVAPQVNPDIGLPYHEWFIEFDKLPSDLLGFKKYLNSIMKKNNIYYFDLIKGNILSDLKIFKVKKSGFQKYMKFIGKLGGQNKVPRLSNNRKIANFLSNL